MKSTPILLMVGWLAVAPLSAEQTPINPTSTYALPVPDKVSFCGSEVPLDRKDLRERFDRELMAANYMHCNTLLTIKRANRLFPLIEPILAAHGIPDDMKYLCCIESSLSIKAVSPAGAAGLWQFVPATAKEYGLQVDSQVDERYHIEKSTAAACRFLRDAYETYHDWSLAAASYNAGRRRITQELSRQQADSFYDLWLSDETSRYVFRILAIKEVMSHPAAYGFHLLAEDLYQPVSYRETSLGSSLENWIEWANKQGITYLQLKEANLWIRDSRLDNRQGKIYTVKLPEEASLHYDPRHLYIHDSRWLSDYE